MKVLLLIIYILVSYNLNAKTKENEKPYRVSDRLHTLDFSEVTEWPSVEVLNERFIELRDKKILNFKDRSRRLPWLFPRDGCHFRSTMLSYESEKLGYGLLNVMFLHGDLVFKSIYMGYGGSIKPRFHAAAIVKVKDEIYVLDPASHYEKPLKLKKWALQFSESTDNDLFAICSAHTYLLSGSCYEQKRVSDERLQQDSDRYLNFEQNTLNYLGYDIEELLFKD